MYGFIFSTFGIYWSVRCVFFLFPSIIFTFIIVLLCPSRVLLRDPGGPYSENSHYFGVIHSLICTCNYMFNCNNHNSITYYFVVIIELVVVAYADNTHELVTTDKLASVLFLEERRPLLRSRGVVRLQSQ